MNRLSRDKRLAVVRLLSSGHTVREICKEVGVARQTVTSLGLPAYRVRLGKLVKKLWNELEKAGLDPMGRDHEMSAWAQAFLDLHYEIGFRCPIHPDADPDKDEVWPDQPCRLCKSDGVSRMHERLASQSKSTNH